MEIIPDGLIFLYSGVPLDPSYKNTLWFDTQVAQSNFFHHTTDPEEDDYLKAVFQKQYYTRVNRGQIKVKICADRIYYCNYLSFMNLSYGAKWFYAFITSIEWVNNEVSLITFDIDVMQTYMFDATLKECFVEREHSATDNVGDNIVPENVTTGEDYVVMSRPQEWQYQPESVIMLMSEDIVGGGSPTVRKEAGLVIGLEQYNDSVNDLTHVQQAVARQGGEAIINMVQVPTKMVDPQNFLHINTFAEDVGGFSALPLSFDGYSSVKNKKLFTSPYCFLYLSNNNGGSVTLRTEDFYDPTNVTFYVQGAPLPEPEVVVYPRNYRRNAVDYETPLMMGNYPSIPFVGDVYKAYVAQHKAADIFKLVSNAIQTAAAVAATAYTGGAASEFAVFSGLQFASNAAKTVSGYISADAQPNSAKNMGNSEAIRVGHSRYKFSAYIVTIKREYAQMIDDYFTVYGYATNKVKVPNRNVRPHFTYTKTNGCTIVGKMPADEIVKMQDIYDKGITFWKNASEVGNYTLDNAPVVNGD